MAEITDEQIEQLRTILEIEGVPVSEIDALIADFRNKPALAERFLSRWRLVTETKQ